jgi:hypothetical protein
MITEEDKCSLFIAEGFNKKFSWQRVSYTGMKCIRLEKKRLWYTVELIYVILFINLTRNWIFIHSKSNITKSN